MIVSTGKSSAVKAALAEKPDVNARSIPNGYTPLHLNVCGLTDDDERQEIIKLLHQTGADLEARTQDKGLTPLQQAALRNRPRCIATLIACGANVCATEGNGATALHGAAFFGYSEVVKVLLAAGADPMLADKHGNTPLSLATHGGHTEVCKLLQKQPTDDGEKLHFCQTASYADLANLNSELLKASELGDVSKINALLSAGADKDAKDANGYTPLLNATCCVKVAVVDLLLKAGANKEIGIKKSTPLHIAAMRNSGDILERLLSAGANTNARNDDGWTPLHLAAHKGHASVVDQLLKAGADIDAKDKKGYTPLFFAAGEGHVAIVKRLIDDGADQSTVDTDGMSPLLIALKEGHNDIAELLLTGCGGNKKASLETQAESKPSSSRLDFTIHPPRGSSILRLCALQGRPISYNGKVVGKAELVDVKTDGRVIITANLDAAHANKQLGIDLVLRD